MTIHHKFKLNQFLACFSSLTITAPLRHEVIVRAGVCPALIRTLGQDWQSEADPVRARLAELVLVMCVNLPPKQLSFVSITFVHPQLFPDSAIDPAELVAALQFCIGDRASVSAILEAILIHLADRTRKDALIRAGAGKAIVEAMSKYACDARVCEHSCGALRILTDWNEVRKEAIFSAGAVEPIIAALSIHGNVPEVCKETCRALCNLATGCDARKEVILGAGAVPILAAACRAHTGQIEQYASLVLKELGFTSYGKKM